MSPHLSEGRARGEVGNLLLCPSTEPPHNEAHSSPSEVSSPCDVSLATVDVNGFQTHHDVDIKLLPTPFAMRTVRWSRAKVISGVLGQLLYQEHSPSMSETVM